MIYYRLGEVIRELRSRLHMTQEELAAGICSVSTIAKIESGSQMPSGRVADALLLLELMETLVMSMPLEELYDETAQRRTYTYLELYMLNSIALQFYYLDSYDHAMRILERLYEYLQEWHRYGEIGRYLYPVVCNNLAAVKLVQGYARPARQLCDAGISKCLNTGMMLPLPEL